MIGLSLSFCIRDLISGNPVRVKQPSDEWLSVPQVLEADVSKIIANTAIRDLNALCERYRQTYWRSNDPWQEAAAVALAKRLWAQGKIEQPRLLDPEYGHYIGQGHWLAGE